MSLDVYFKCDIQQGLIATALIAINVAQAQGFTNLEYLKGVLDITKAQAALYGLNWQGMCVEIQQQSSFDVLSMMEKPALVG